MILITVHVYIAVGMLVLAAVCIGCYQGSTPLLLQCIIMSVYACINLYIYHTFYCMPYI